MTARILLIGFIAACVLGGHLSAVLLFAAAFIVVSVHLFPLLATIAVVGAAVVLAGLLLLRCLSLHREGCLVWGAS